MQILDDDQLREKLKKLPRKNFTNWEFLFFRDVVIRQAGKPMSDNKRRVAEKLLEKHHETSQ